MIGAVPIFADVKREKLDASRQRCIRNFVSVAAIARAALLPGNPVEGLHETILI